MLTTSATPAATLARHAFFAGAPPDVLSRLAGHARWFDADPDRIILDFEDPTTDVYFIVQGHVRVLFQTASGERTQILDDFAAGDVVGEMAAIDGVPRSARIEALVRTQMCSLSARAFHEAVFGSREIGLRLMQLLTSRIRKQNRRLLEMTALPIRLRLVAELLRLSRPRPDGSRLLNPLPTQEELGVADRCAAGDDLARDFRSGGRRDGAADACLADFARPDGAASGRRRRAGPAALVSC